MKTTITAITAREIIDSRGYPTIEVACTTTNGVVGVASVPSGASTGTHEALELRDNDQTRFGGKGVQKAVAHVCGEIAQHIVGNEYNQRSLDDALILLDGTNNKSRLGANAILGVSLAFARACAQVHGVALYEYLKTISGTTDYTLPQPMFNIINGGKHADSGLDIQEFMIGPVAFPSIAEKIRVASEVIVALRKVLQKRGLTVGVGDEGGFAPQLTSNEEAFDCIIEAINNAGYTTDQVKIGIDVAASSFYTDGVYTLSVGGTKVTHTQAGMLAWYEALIQKYPIISIEDGFHEEYWEGFSQLTQAHGDAIAIVGDDLLVTNVARIATAIEYRSVNSVLIKVNQIGSLSETIDAILKTKQAGWAPFISHRSGETTDTFIADLSVGLACPYIKSGALIRGERVCKYNRLMEIEQSL